MKWRNRNERKLDPIGRVKNEPKRLKAMILPRTLPPLPICQNMTDKYAGVYGVIFWPETIEGRHRVLDKFEKEQKKR